MNTNQKQLILIGILSSILVILIMGFFLLQRQKKIDNQSATQSGILQTNPTGIIIPTQEIKSHELDIVEVYPIDRKQDVGLKTPITISFSRKFQLNELEFFISPNSPASIEVEGMKLIIQPIDTWTPGTNYSYSVNFPSDVTKVRLYGFTTTGPTSIGYPDTAPQDYFQSELQKQKTERTDLYVANQTPFESDIFSITSEYTIEPPNHFYFKVQSKITDQSRITQEVHVWLQSLDLTQDQINSLDIRYQ